MTQQVQWTEEELAELRRLVDQEWTASREELHHTANIDYKAKLKTHLRLLGDMRQKLEPSVAAL